MIKKTVKPSAGFMKRELKRKFNRERAKKSAGFFKTGKGDYGEGDVFLGLSVPEVRSISRNFFSLPFSEIEKNLHSCFHEERLAGLLVLVERFKRLPEERKNIFEFYLENIEFANNWDLIDLTSDKIMGEWLADKKDRSLLYSLSRSQNLWRRRAAIVSTFALIKRGELDDTFNIASVLLKDGHDLIKKAVGWMLREAGKVDLLRLKEFIRTNKSRMSRTTLRYSIEKFPETERKKFLSL